MLPSNFSAGDTEYLGPILLNPGLQLCFQITPQKPHDSLIGGPGDSGIAYLQDYGDSFREIIGPQFDLVSFDPRGSFRLWTFTHPSFWNVTP